VQLNIMDFHIEITGKHVIKTILFLAVAVVLIFLAFSDGRSTLTTTEDKCTQNAIAAGVEPVGCAGP
jgi:hypothetical protein